MAGHWAGGRDDDATDLNLGSACFHREESEPTGQYACVVSDVKHYHNTLSFLCMVALSYLLVWMLVAFGILVAGSFVGTVLALQYYHSGGTLSFSFDEFIKRFNNDRR